MNSSRQSHRYLKSASLACCTVAVAVASGLLAGCGKEEPPPQVVAPPPPPPPPPPPQVRSVADLMAELRIDSRVQLAEDRAPQSTAARKAILEFCDAFARSDDRALASFLEQRDRRELDAMVESGQWKTATENLSRIEVYQTGQFEERQCALVLYEVDFELQPQLWYYTGSGDTFVFEAAPTPPDIANRLSGLDWIQSWHAVLRDEAQEAARPDVAVTVPQRVLEEAEDTSVGRTDEGPGGPGPGSPNPSEPAPGGPSPITPSPG